MCFGGDDVYDLLFGWTVFVFVSRTITIFLIKAHQRATPNKHGSREHGRARMTTEHNKSATYDTNGQRDNMGTTEEQERQRGNKKSATYGTKGK